MKHAFNVSAILTQSLEMMPSVLNTDPIPLVYQNATGVPNVTTVTNVPKMSKNDPDMLVFGSAHFHMAFERTHY